MEPLLDELLTLEHAGWHSLCTGSGDEFYGRTMTDDARMVMGNGSVMTHDDVVSALADAPAWASYEIDDPVVVRMGDDAAALVYMGTGRRPDGGHFTGVMTSVYARDSNGWRLALHQQTPTS